MPDGFFWRNCHMQSLQGFWFRQSRSEYKRLSRLYMSLNDPGHFFWCIRKQMHRAGHI